MRRGFLLLVLMIAGCEKTVPAPVATTSPAATQSATTTVTTRPAAVISINGHAGVFPPARLRLESDDQHIIATLFSDDPKEALKNNYKGNSFYIRMELDIPDATELDPVEAGCVPVGPSGRHNFHPLKVPLIQDSQFDLGGA